MDDERYVIFGGDKIFYNPSGAKLYTKLYLNDVLVYNVTYK